jgi:calcineurin-like phosphoesterase
LNQKTAFMCDLGMCGPVESVLGVDIETIIAHVVDGKPGRFEVAKGAAMLNGALIRLDLEQHVALSIERVHRSEMPFVP